MQIPSSKHTFRFSTTALGLLAATVVLGVILLLSTLRNIDRAESVMEQFLLDKGETILHAIEAGSRATMRHHMGGGNPLQTLLREYARESDIVFISIRESGGRIVEQVGTPTGAGFSPDILRGIAAGQGSVSRLHREPGLFTLSKRFAGNTQTAAQGDLILSIGLHTELFDDARRQDVHHAIFMAAMLFLLGSAGLYFLFLSQKMRISGLHLADMKIYTDNIIESIPVAIITLDAEDRVVSGNRNTEELFGAGISSMRGKTIAEAVPDCSLLRPAACDIPVDYEVECRAGDHRLLPLRISCSPLVNNENHTIGKVLIIRDMSSIREMEMQLERSRRMAALGKMAAGIAHEIRNPLGTLRGFAQFFGSQTTVTEDSKHYSDLMISEIDRLNQTVSSLLQFSRPREPHLQDIAIDQLFAKTVSMMEADIASSQIELQWQRDSGIMLTADPDLMLQVLMNLVKNSIGAASAGGIIALSAARQDHEVRITVSDNGCGMSEDVRERMFDPFFSTTRTGTGLGLAVSHQIVEAHGGMFEVATKPGKGTAITVRLPQS